MPGRADLQGTVPRGRGKRGSRFLIPPALTKALSPRHWQGPLPLPQCCAGIRTSRGPKPPASARPAPGGRFAPAGSGAGLSWCLDQPIYRAPSRSGGETRVAFPGPARRGVLRDALSLWQGPSRLPQRHADPWPAGGQSTRPAPDPPPAGASRPPGRALACVPPGPAGLQGTVPRGRGKRAAFPVPAWIDESTFTAAMAGAIAPAIALRRYQDQPGAKAPGQRPTRPGGRWPSAGPGPADLRGTVARGRGKRGSRFLIPPGTVAAFATDQNGLPVRQAATMLFSTSPVHERRPLSRGDPLRRDGAKV